MSEVSRESSAEGFGERVVEVFGELDEFAREDFDSVVGEFRLLALGEAHFDSKAVYLARVYFEA